MRKLVTIQKIEEIYSHPNADRLEIAKVQGWEVVVRKGEHIAGEYVVYCEVDCILPDLPEFEFLRQDKFRIKAKKIRGVVSLGIIFPLSLLLNVDITIPLGVVKYEPKEMEEHMRGNPAGNFPFFIPKTDETRIQICGSVIEELTGKPYYISEKVDGSNINFFKRDGVFGVCSRNLELKPDPPNTYWDMAYKFIEVETFPDNFAVQGEICGPGIQKNRIGLTEKQIFVFNVYDIQKQQYLDFIDFRQFCKRYNLPTVPIFEQGESFNYSIQDLHRISKGNYSNGKEREGIVIRPQLETYSHTLKGRLSFKVLNSEYLLQE